MPGESQKLPASEPDPSVFTTDQIRFFNAWMRDYVDGQIHILEMRFNGIDEATRILHETVTRTPTDMQVAIGHLKELMVEKFHSVGTQFTERDDRTKAEGVANEVKVNAAFAAQEKVAVQYNLASQASIDKSEKNTNELIKQNAETSKISFASQDKQLADLKERLTKIESVKLGGQEQSQGFRAAVGFGISLIFVAIAIIGFIIANKPN